jgi:hypothetical protein
MQEHDWLSESDNKVEHEQEQQDQDDLLLLPVSSECSASSEQQHQSAGSFCGSCLSVEHYRPYFNVDTIDVKERIVAAVTVWKGNALSDLIKQKDSDVYGPFWISSTLIFIVAVTSNIDAWSKSNGNDFENDISSIASSMTLVYSFAFGFPLLTYTGMRCATLECSLVDLICIHGYSLAVYIPACVLSVIPNK